MKQVEIIKLHSDIKSGSWKALSTLIEEELLKESLKKLKMTRDDFRYCQARVATLEEIQKLLPETH